MAKRRYKKVKVRRRRKVSSVNVTRGVSFRRDVLVQNPENRFLNQRFGISLFEEAQPTETLEAAYSRLKEQAGNLLAKDIIEYYRSCLETTTRHFAPALPSVQA